MNPTPYNLNRWRQIRLAYYLALLATATLIGFYFGPNYFLFGKLTSLNPADFTDYVKSNGLPLLRAVREYKQSHGQYPREIRSLETNGHQFYGGLYIEDGRLFLLGPHVQYIYYDLNAVNAKWIVDGRFANGEIPGIPPESPSTQPSSK